MSAKENEAEKVTKKKQRSPNYPIIPISQALTRLRQIYKQDRRAFTTSSAILEHMGYSTKGKAGKSGTGGRMVSALRQYGLLDEKNDQFRVSDVGFKILELPEDSEERAELIKQAALKPSIFSKILAYYKGEVPSDTALRSHLVLHEGFNPAYVDQFIRVFRAIIDVVNPSADDYNTDEESEGAEQSSAGGKPTVSQTPPRFTGQPSAEMRRAVNQGRPGADDDYKLAPLPGAAMQFTFYLSQTKQGTLSIPFSMTKKEWELLKKQIQSSLDVAQATALMEEEEPSRAELAKSKGTGERPLEPHSLMDDGMTDE